MRREHRNTLTPLEAGLTEILTEPKFAIGQRALLVETPAGNVLWDAVSLVDEETVAALEARGGVSALAMSHPHMFGSMVEWSHAFGGAPVYLHESNKPWVMRPDPVVRFWTGDSFGINDHVSLRLTGGHFEGSTVLHWPPGAAGRGVLLTSDSMHVTYDRRFVSFMYSFPNYIPFSAAEVDAIVSSVEDLAFDRIYSHFAGLVIERDAKQIVRRSAERYKRAILGELRATRSPAAPLH
jgi:hypothetical protein